MPFTHRGAAGDAHIHITAYENFQRPSTFFEIVVTYPYRVAVFDESRGFDDPSSVTHAHIDELRSVSRRWVPFTVAVTGTPICASLQLNCHMLAAGGCDPSPRVVVILALPILAMAVILDPDPFP